MVLAGSNQPANGGYSLLFLVQTGRSARLFGGDMTAVAVVFVATLCGYYLKQLMLSKKIDVRIVFIVCAFVFICAGLCRFAFLPRADAAGCNRSQCALPCPWNPVAQFLQRHDRPPLHLFFFSRMTDALVLVSCLSMGLCMGMWAMEIGMF